MSQDEQTQLAGKIISALTGYNLQGTHRLNDIEFLADILRQQERVIHETTVALDEARTHIRALEHENGILQYPITRALSCTWAYLGFVCGFRDAPDHTVYTVRVG